MKKRITIDKTLLKKAIENSWSLDTCYPPDKPKWNKDNPAIGQCAVTALLIQKHYGGEILFNKELNHYWNKLPNDVIDLTKIQFQNAYAVIPGRIVTRKDIITGKTAKKVKTKKRFRILDQRVTRYIKEYKPTLLLLSSNSQKEYILDILETIAYPPKFVHHFRYQLSLLDDEIKQALPTISDGSISGIFNTKFIAWLFNTTLFAWILNFKFIYSIFHSISFLSKTYKRTLPQKLINSDVLVAYLNQRIEHNKYEWQNIYPLRYGTIIYAFKTGETDQSIAHFYFELKNFVSPKNDFLDFIKIALGHKYNVKYVSLLYKEFSPILNFYLNNEHFNDTCNEIQKIGFKISNTTYDDPLFLSINNIYYKKNFFYLFWVSRILKPKYDRFSHHSYFKIKETKEHTINLDTFTPSKTSYYSLKLNFDDKFFTTPDKYDYRINSQYDHINFKLISSFIEKPILTICNIELSKETGEHKNSSIQVKAPFINFGISKSQVKNEPLNLNINLPLFISRRFLYRFIDWAGDTAFGLGTAFIALGKILNSNQWPKWLMPWDYGLIGFYSLWIILKFATKFLRGK